MPDVSTHHSSVFAFFVESTQGEGPGYSVGTPQGTAAAWAAAEGTTAFRMRHFEADPAPLKPSNIDDPALVSRPFEKNTPIPGLSSADGGSLVLGLHGSEATTADASQVTETALMTLMEHMLGGLHRGNTTSVGAVTDAVTYAVASATNLEEGAMVAIEDADNTGKLYFQRINTISGTDVTLDEAPNFTPATSDVLHACATIYPDADNLQSGGTNYSTLSLYYQKGDAITTAHGCSLQLDSISFERNTQPKLNISVMAAGTFPPSTSSSISAPTWTGSVQGDQGTPVGRNMVLRVSQAGTSAYVCVPCETVEFIPGVNKVPLNTATQCDGAMEGRAGYTFEPGNTELRVNLFLDPDYQDWFDTTQELEVTFEYQGAPGESWCIKLPSAYLLESPDYNQSQSVNMHQLVFNAHEPTPSGNQATDNLAMAKFEISLA